MGWASGIDTGQRRWRSFGRSYIMHCIMSSCSVQLGMLCMGRLGRKARFELLYRSPLRIRSVVWCRSTTLARHPFVVIVALIRARYGKVRLLLRSVLLR